MKIDLFITHGWTYHDDWHRLVAELDAHPGLQYRNFSRPWHDPSVAVTSAEGQRFLASTLAAQFVPVHAVILLTAVYQSKDAHSWVSAAVTTARTLNKPVIALPRWGEDTVPQDVRQLADICLGFDVPKLVTTIRQQVPEFAAVVQKVAQ